MDLLTKEWAHILKTVKQEYNITDISFKTWLAPLEIFSVQNDTLVILFPTDESNQMSLNYISKKYELPLKVTIAEITGKEYHLQFILPGQATNLKPSDVVSQGYRPADRENFLSSHLNPRYTFDTFVVGANNRFAQTASLAVAESPGQAYNPLFIYGGPGLGKTHLMHAIGNFILQDSPSKKVLYVTSEDFLNEVIESIRNNSSGSMSRFRDKYRTVDILLIDDIQFIIGKESTQEEFFHTFNALHSAGKQIVLTSDRPPKEMETLDTRIRSRFEWGLMADVGSPDYETRMAILRRRCEMDRFSLPDEILDYIASNIKSNIRELEGALNKLIAYSNLEKTTITMEIASRELQNIISPDTPREITPQLIIEMVSEHYQISVDQMISKNRSSAVAKPRQIAMYLCKDMTSSPLEAIGSLLGGRDHSTIIHGANKIADEYNSDEELHNQLDAIRKKLNPS